VEHAHRIESYLRALGVTARTVTGDTPAAQRDEIVASYQRGDIRCLVNVNVLGTGFDAPATDLLAFLRPTKSPGLYVQFAGRGMRTHPMKQDCLVLDFARLIQEHGPVDRVNPPRRRKKKAETEAPIKECPKCLALLHAGLRQCPECGERFGGAGPELEEQPSPLEVLASGRPAEIEVTRMTARPHFKEGKPPSVRVAYYSGLRKVADEWVCVLHDGFAGEKAARWWAENVGGALPEDIEDAVAAVNEIDPPRAIVVMPDGKFSRIIRRVYGGR